MKNRTRHKRRGRRKKTTQNMKRKTQPVLNQMRRRRRKRKRKRLSKRETNRMPPGKSSWSGMTQHSRTNSPPATLLFCNNQYNVFSESMNSLTGFELTLAYTCFA